MRIWTILKKALNFLSEEVFAVKLQQKMIFDLVDEVKSLKLQNAEKDKRITFLENQVLELEWYTWKNNMIITGLHIKPRSYAQAVTAEADETADEKLSDSVEQQVTSFLLSKGTEADKNSRSLSSTAQEEQQ